MSTRKIIVGMMVVLFAVASLAEAKGPQADTKSLLNSVKVKTGNRGTLQESPRILPSRDGYLRFVGAAPFTYFEAEGKKSAEPNEAAGAFLKKYRNLFVNKSDKVGFEVKRVKTRGKRTFVRYKQTYAGIEVFGADMIIQVNADGGIGSASSDIMRNSGLLDSGKVSVIPGITASAAEKAAVKWLAEQHKGLELEATPATLMIYEPSVIGPDGPTQLVWETEVGNTGVQLVKECILIDAQTGEVAFHYPLIYDDLYRQIYGKYQSRMEGQFETMNDEIDRAYDYVGDTYNFYLTEHGRDSIDDNGMPIVVHVEVTQYGGESFYCNAMWNGSAMYFYYGFTWDDIVAHEYTHGVTQYESNLIYSYQSGAINESFSDMWGEWVDQTYHRGENDSPSVKWKMGEDVTGCMTGPFRDMKTPPTFQHPDYMSSPYYYHGSWDNGGVHTNSGVGNKLCYLLTDGDTFRSYTIFGMGISKTADLMYDCQTNRLGRSSDYEDFGTVLVQAAADFYEDSTLTLDEYQNVVRACSAVEIYGEFAVVFDQDYYNCSDTAGISLGDADLIGESTQDVNVSTSDGDLETVTLSATEPNGFIFAGSISTDSGDPNIGDGILQVSHGETITVTYHDMNDGAGNEVNVVDTAEIDCQPPVIFDVNYNDLVPVPPGSITITFETDEDASVKIYCGEDCNGPYTIQKTDASFKTQHSITLTGLSASTQYYFVIEATDRWGNVDTDDNNGNCYDFYAYPINIYVPGDFNSIQGAIDGQYTLDGCVIWVDEGTYYENLYFNGKAITVRSNNPSDWDNVNATVINGSSSPDYPAVWFPGGEDPNTILKGFTIRGGTYGIYCYGSTPTISNCIIENYNGSSHHYGISHTSCNNFTYPVTIKNNIIRNNYYGIRTDGGASIIENNLIYGNYRGAYADTDSSTTIRGNTIVDNTDYGIKLNSSYTPTIYNCILWDNGDDLYGCSATYSCIEDCDAGEGNICSDPCFVDADADNYHLSADSPCYNAGDQNRSYPGQVDIDGDSRVMHQRVDIGADEFGKVHNVTKNRWYDTIQTAISTSSSYDLIVVSPGTYTENISFGGKTVTVRSTDPNDWGVVEATVIDGSGSPDWPAVYFGGGESPDTILQGFTIRNGNYGVYGYCTRGTIRNCIIDGYSTSGKCGVSYCQCGSPPYPTGLTVKNSIIRNNYSGIQTDSGDVTIENSLIYGNYYGIRAFYGTYATISNNTIVDNTYGITAQSSSLAIRNCILWGNNDDLYGCSATFSCIEDCDAGEGNICSDPCFVDADANDYHLSGNSPCIDAGDPNRNYDGQFDIDNYNRVSGENVDIGADEYSMVDNITQRKGYFIIQDAIDEAGNGDIIEVKPGTYTGTGNRDIDFLDKSITVRSTDPNDPCIVSTTIVDCNANRNNRHCGFYFHRGEDRNSVLDGITITRGYGQYIAFDSMYSGGAVFCYGSSPTIRRCILRNNMNDKVNNDTYGGAIGCYLEGWSSTKPLIENCVIYDNEAYYGGGISVVGLSATIRNCMIFDNNAERGGGIDLFWGYNVDVNNCTIVNNSADNGGGICNNGTHSKTITSCILWGNGDDLYGCSATYSCIEDGDAGEGNIYDDPCIGDDLHITPVSPCMNAGDPNGNYDDQVDIDGDPRVLDGKVDIGADETTGVYNITQNKAYLNIQSAIDDAEANDVIALSPIVYKGEGNRDLDFQGKAITLQSTVPDDPCVVSATIIDCNGSRNDQHNGFCFHSGENNNSVLDGFTITNGYGHLYESQWYAGGAIYCEGSSPTIRRCILKNNMNDSANYDTDGGAIACYFGANPLIEYCNIIDNEAYYSGGISIWDSSPTIRNCAISDNNAFEGGGFGIYDGDSIEITNCTIVNNSAYSGGGIYSLNSTETITNCILWGNGDDLYDCSATYSCIEDGDEGTGNISSDPCFVSAFHIDIHSPCVNAGDPNGDYDGQVDIDGDSRVIGSYVDMGADEVNVPVSDAHQWGLDEKSGTTAYDSVDDDDGTFNGNDPCWVDGIIGGAVDFNGVNDYFSVSSLDTAYSNSSVFTVAGWFKTNQSTGIQTIVGQWSQCWEAGQEYYGWQVLVYNNKVVARFGYAIQTPDVTGTTTVTNGEWHHFAMVRNGTSTALYVDGQPEDSGTANFYVYNTKFRIGDGSYKFNGNPALKGGPFNGIIDDVMIFDEALSAEDVERLYEEVSE